jgi:hypothetical protein
MSNRGLTGNSPYKGYPDLGAKGFAHEAIHLGRSRGDAALPAESIARLVDLGTPDPVDLPEPQDNSSD